MDDAYEVILAIEGLYPDLDQIYNEMERKALGHVDRGLFVQLLDADGQVMRIQRQTARFERRSPATQSDKPQLLAIGDYRMVQRAVTKPGLPRYTVRVGASLAMVEQRRRHADATDGGRRRGDSCSWRLSADIGWPAVPRARWRGSSPRPPRLRPATWRSDCRFAARRTSSISSRTRSIGFSTCWATIWIATANSWPTRPTNCARRWPPCKARSKSR